MQPGANFRKGKVEVFGYPVEYAEAGTGDAIVFLPGSAGLEMSTAKDMLAEQYRVVEINPPGWGESASLTGSMHQRDLAVVIGAAIKALGIEQYHLVGTSMGGNNAMWTAYHFPERVRSLSLEGPMLFCLPDNLVHPEGGPPPPELLRQGVIKYDSTMYPAPPAHPRKPWSGGDFFHEQMRRRFKMFAYIEGMDDTAPLEDFAREAPMPITLILGTADEILKPSYADRFRQVVPGARVEIIEGATHDAQNTAPEEFVAALRKAIV